MTFKNLFCIFALSFQLYFYLFSTRFNGSKLNSYAFGFGNLNEVVALREKNKKRETYAQIFFTRKVFKKSRWNTKPSIVFI